MDLMYVFVVTRLVTLCSNFCLNSKTERNGQGHVKPSPSLRALELLQLFEDHFGHCYIIYLFFLLLFNQENVPSD